MMALVRAIGAELGVLARWRVAWCLCLAVPVFMVVVQISVVLPLVGHPPDLSVAPAQNDTWAVSLNYLVPLVFNLTSYGAVLAMSVGAVVGASDWQRRTVISAQLAGPGRMQPALARAVGVWAILALSAIASFALPAAVCTLSGVLAPHWFIEGQRSLPSIGSLAHGIELLVFTNAAYGSLGLVAGSLTRRIGPAIALCLIYALGVNEILLELGADTHGLFAFLYAHTPDAAMSTLSAPFGEPGGGGVAAPASNTLAHTTLWVCLLGFAALHVALDYRDVGPGATRWHFRTLWRGRWRFAALHRRGSKTGSQRPSSIFAATRAELSIIRRWPSILPLAAVFPFWGLIINYVLPYALHVEKVIYAVPSQYVPWLMPRQVLDVTLNFLDPGPDPLGVLALVLIGAWLAASSWGEGGVLSLALTQGQGRIQVVLGHALAAIAAAAASVLVGLGIAVFASELLSVALSGSSSLPRIGHLATGVGEAVLIAAAYVTAGWVTGFLVKSVGLATVIVIGWVVVIQPALIGSAGPLVHGAMHVIYDLLPGTLALSLSYGHGVDKSAFTSGGFAPAGGTPSVTTACWLLATYILVALAAASLIAARRDVHGSHR